MAGKKNPGKKKRDAGGAERAASAARREEHFKLVIPPTKPRRIGTIPATPKITTVEMLAE